LPEALLVKGSLVIFTVLPARFPVAAAVITTATASATIAVAAIATTTAAAAPAAKAATTATAAASAIFAWLGFIDVQVATIDFFSIELSNGSLALFFRGHFNEAEAA
jgi:hypothetical protein